MHCQFKSNCCFYGIKCAAPASEQYDTLVISWDQLHHPLQTVGRVLLRQIRGATSGLQGAWIIQSSIPILWWLTPMIIWIILVYCDELWFFGTPFFQRFKPFEAMRQKDGNQRSTPRRAWQRWQHFRARRPWIIMARDAAKPRYRGTGNSKSRVPGKHGWFGLRMVTDRPTGLDFSCFVKSLKYINISLNMNKPKTKRARVSFLVFSWWKGLQYMGLQTGVENNKRFAEFYVSSQKDLQPPTNKGFYWNHFESTNTWSFDEKLICKQEKHTFDFERRKTGVHPVQPRCTTKSTRM